MTRTAAPHPAAPVRIFPDAEADAQSGRQAAPLLLSRSDAQSTRGLRTGLYSGSAPSNDTRLVGRLAGLRLNVLLQRIDQPRFPQPGLADEQDNLAHPFLGLLPAVF